VIILAGLLAGCGGMMPLSNPTPTPLPPFGKATINSVSMNSGERKFAFLNTQKIDVSRWNNIRCTVELGLEPATVHGGMAFRVVDSVDCYFVMLKPDQRAIVFGKVVNGVWFDLASKNLTIAPGTFHQVEITARGSQITVIFDHNLVIAANDIDYSSGGVSLIAEAQGTVTFKSIEVDSAP
jgi:hypothetical protein